MIRNIYATHVTFMHRKERGKLNRHKKSIHDGKKFPCDSCDSYDYQANESWKLTIHKKSIHVGKTYIDLTIMQIEKEI